MNTLRTRARPMIRRRNLRDIQAFCSSSRQQIGLLFSLSIHNVLIESVTMVYYLACMHACLRLHDARLKTSRAALHDWSELPAGIFPTQHIVNTVAPA